jgi:restriction endonuclease Mrr
VGPQVVRELEGAIKLADFGSSIVSRGLIVTTSSFSAGAQEVARALGFELIDGARFSSLLAPL